MIPINVVSEDPLAAEGDLLVFACSDVDLGAGGLIDRLDALTGERLRRAIVEERFRAKPGQSLTMHLVPGLGATASVRFSRFALVGLGGVDNAEGAAPGASLDPLTRSLRSAAGTAARLGSNAGARSMVLTWSPRGADLDGAPLASLQAAAEGVALGMYRFDKYLTDDRSRPSALAEITLVPPTRVAVADGGRVLERARSTARSVARARDLVNEPAGFLTPARMADTITGWVKDAAQEHLNLEVLDRAACEALGMGLFLAVARGSVEEPRFIHLSWAPPGARRRVVLVGKGVTFDSGGLSLKTNEGMLDMKTDMAGAAAVLTATLGAAAEKLPVEIHALAACTENMPSGTAYKLGDVIRSMGGKTVEITNTDAEGRLTLADAITFGLRLRPDILLDVATLTGACVVALGPHTAGLMSNDDALATSVCSAAARAGEDIWRMPLPPRLGEQLKSEIADLKNTGERWGGALTAGLFLKEFVGSTAWAHLDIAGPSSTNKESGHVGKGGTGFGVATILELLRRDAP